MKSAAAAHAGIFNRAWLWAWLAGALLAALAGCVTQPTVGGDASAASLSTAEEPDYRKRARIRMELAVGYFEEGKTDVALAELRQVLALDSSFPDAYNLGGLIYMRLNDMRAAEDYFRRAMALNPRDGGVLHNLGWLQCQQSRFDESVRSFEQALANPLYGDRAKTFLALGVCQARAGRKAEGETNLARSYELDAGNPVTGYNLANLLFQRGEFERAQFYIRRINNSELANAQSLWLGIRVERKMNNRTALAQLAEQLRKRFPQSREANAFQRGAFDE